MTQDDLSGARFVAFCRRLPAIDGERAQAEADARFAIECFKRRRQDLQDGMHAPGAAAYDFAATRCEIDAVDTAIDVIARIWERRFGGALSG